MFPIVCTACNERAVIPFLPPDLTCVACKTGEHIDLDDGLVTTASDEVIQNNLGPAHDVPYEKGWAEGEADAAAGKPPKYDLGDYSQSYEAEGYLDAYGNDGRALAGKRESALGDPDLPMMLLPQGTPDQDQDVELLRGENAGKRKVIIPKGSPPYSQRALASKTAKVCPDCNGSQSVPQSGGEDPADVDNGYVQCPTCKGTGTVGDDKQASAWEHGGGEQVYSCYLDMDCPVTGTAAEMEAHYATNHLDSANRALLANPQRTKVAINKIADFATVIASLGACNGTRVNVVYSSDFKGVTTVSGMLTYASGHATVQTMDGLVDIPASQVLAVDRVGYADFPDQRTEPTGTPSPLDYAHVGPSTVASKTAVTDGDTSTCKNCEQPIEYAETAWVHTPSYAIRCTGGDGRVTQVANTVAEPKTAAKQAEYQSDGGVYTGGGCTTPGCKGTVEKTSGPNALTGVDRFKCSECGQTYRGPAKESAKQALSYEDDDAYDEGFEDGITGAPMATGLAAYTKGYQDGQAAKSSNSLVLSKLLSIAAAVTETNPGMPGRTALKVARKTLERYPRVAG